MRYRQETLILERSAEVHGYSFQAVGLGQPFTGVGSLASNRWWLVMSECWMDVGVYFLIFLCDHVSTAEVGTRILGQFVELFETSAPRMKGAQPTETGSSFGPSGDIQGATADGRLILGYQIEGRYTHKSVCVRCLRLGTNSLGTSRYMYILYT